MSSVISHLAMSIFVMNIKKIVRNIIAQLNFMVNFLWTGANREKMAMFHGDRSKSGKVSWSRTITPTSRQK